jgi:hypothetical protein
MASKAELTKTEVLEFVRDLGHWKRETSTLAGESPEFSRKLRKVLDWIKSLRGQS